MMMNCGDVRQIRPSFEGWVTYGLWSENQNRPGFIVLCPDGLPTQGNQNGDRRFFPGFLPGDADRHTGGRRFESLSKKHMQQCELRPTDSAANWSAGEAQPWSSGSRSDDALLEARVQSFELALSRQMEADDAFD